MVYVAYFIKNIALSIKIFGTSARKENRWKKRLKEKNQEKPTGIPRPQRQAISTPNMNNPCPPEEDDDDEIILGQSPMFQPKHSPRLAALNK